MGNHASALALLLLVMSSVAALAESASPAPAEEARSLPRLRVNPEVLEQRRISVLDDGRLLRVTPQNADRLLQAGTVAVEKTGTEAAREVDARGIPRFRLPYQYTVMEPAAGGTVGARTFRPDVYPRSALRFVGRRNAYVAQVGIGVWEDEPSGPRSVTEPIVLSLGSVSLDSIEPRDLEVTRLNAYQDVEVTSRSLSSEPAINVRPSFDASGVTVPLPVGPRPSLDVSIPPAEILGLGLEAGVANVLVRDALEPEGMSFTLEIDRGWLSNGGRVTLDRAGTASIGFRSVGFGPASITSTDPIFAGVRSDRVSFAVPWLFALFVIAGGAAGTVATRRAREHWGTALGIGIATGLVVVFAYAVGINLLDVAPRAEAGEALAFVLAALGAAIGPGLLRRDRDGGAG